MREKAYYIENSQALDTLLEVIKLALPFVQIEREYIEMDYSKVTIVANDMALELIMELLAPLV